jgi:hypothetical protein
MHQGRVADAEVVDGQADAQLAKLQELGRDALQVVELLPFRQLDVEVAGRKAALGQGGRPSAAGHPWPGTARARC